MTYEPLDKLRHAIAVESGARAIHSRIAWRKNAPLPHQKVRIDPSIVQKSYRRAKMHPDVIGNRYTGHILAGDWDEKPLQF